MKKILALALLIAIFLVPQVAYAVSVTSGLTEEVVVSPGEKVAGVITLRNSGETPEAVRAYQTDYLFYADGRTVYGEPGSTPRSNASWITIYPTEVTLPRGGEATIHYQIEVPPENLAGTYWSMVMIEPQAPPSEEITPEEGKIQLGIQTVLRYGIQIVTHLGDSGKRELNILDRQISKEGEDYLLALDLENTGEHWLRPEVRAEIYDEEGMLLGKKEGGKYRIYPGTSVRATLNLGALSKGKYKVLVVMDNGDQYIWGAQYSLNLQ